MAHKRLFGIHIFYLLTVIYAVSTTILGVIYNNGLILFLGWNVILATLVFLLAELFVKFRHKRYPFWMSYAIFLGYILFFPNTFYLLTDTIHFQAYTFFTDYPSVYALMVSDWLLFMIVTIGALYGVKLGISSLEMITPYHYAYIKKHQKIFFVTLCILSSVGIYLGRFIRLNSWNIFDIKSIASGIFNHLDFFIQFVIMFTMIHLVSYFLFSSQHKIKYNHNKESEEY